MLLPPIAIRHTLATNPMTSKHDASSPVIWPPVIYGSLILVAAAASWLWPWHYLPWRIATVSPYLGGALFALAVAIALAAGRRFKSAGTPVPVNRPTTAIVTGGIYGRTRNPIYLGMTLALAGLGIAFDQLWFLLAIPVAMQAVTKLAIKREEAYLASKFGQDYLAYKARVRRWI